MKNETIVFTDVYGKEYTTYKQVCVEYNLHPKTLAKRKASALKKGNTDIHGLIEKYIIEKNPDYKTKQINAKKTQSLKDRVAKTKDIFDNATPVKPVSPAKPATTVKPATPVKPVTAKKRDLPIESFDDFESVYDSVDVPADETPSIKSPETIKIIQRILDEENGDGSDNSSKPVKAKTKKNVAQLIKLLENKPVIPKTNVFHDEAVALCGQDELLAAYRKIINKYIGDSVKMGVINEHYLQALKYFDDVKVWVQSIDLPEIN